MGRDPKEPRNASGVEQSRTSNEAQRKTRRQNRGSGDVADWASVNAEQLHAAITAVTARGCALQLGYTRDGGAYSFRIVGDGEPYVEYVRPTEDMALYLDGLVKDFSAV